MKNALDEITAREVLFGIIAKLPAGQDQAAGHVLDGYIDAIEGNPSEYEGFGGSATLGRLSYETGYYLHNRKDTGLTTSAWVSEIVTVISAMLLEAKGNE